MSSVSSFGLGPGRYCAWVLAQDQTNGVVPGDGGTVSDQEDRERTERERERERDRGREEKTIARLTDEEAMRHDRAAVAIAVLSSRRSSVEVIVVVRLGSLVIVAVGVVCVVVRLGSWPILCLGPGTGPDQRSGPRRRRDCVRPGGPRADRERERERDRGREEKTIARLTDEEAMRHDRAAVAIAVLSSRRSSVEVIVVVKHRSLVVVAVGVVCVVVRLGSWPILCLGPGTSSRLIHQLARRPQVQ